MYYDTHLSNKKNDYASISITPQSCCAVLYYQERCVAPTHERALVYIATMRLVALATVRWRSWALAAAVLAWLLA